ncbi:MAG: FtsB family cell division protein [Motilibacteraceae bacterium]
MTSVRRGPAPRTGERAPRRGAGRRPTGSAPRPGAGKPRTRSGARPSGPAGNLTGRAAILALVVCALALTLAYPLRSYLAQRGEIAAARERVAAKQAEVADLQRQLNRWQDPAYVKAQARERLHYVVPGETQYVVLEPDETGTAGGAQAAAAAAPGRPWFSTLWGSVQGADRSGPARPAPAPSQPSR